MPHDDAILGEVFRKTGGTCRYCGEQLHFSNYGKRGRRGAWVVDHANPVSRGGTDYLRNPWPACFRCNLEKGDRTAQSYLRSLEPRPAPGDCFIATAAFGTPWAHEIDGLRELRDTVLLASRSGTALVSLYYAVSPGIARWVAGNSNLRAIVRPPLRILSRTAGRILKRGGGTACPVESVTYLDERDHPRRDSHDAD